MAIRLFDEFWFPIFAWIVCLCRLNMFEICCYLGFADVADLCTAGLRQGLAGSVCTDGSRFRGLKERARSSPNSISLCRAKGIIERNEY